MTGIMDFMKYIIWWSSLDCVILIRVVVRKKRDYVGKIPKLGGGSDPNPLLDVYLIYLNLWFLGEDQKRSWGSKMKNKPNFFLITLVSQTGGGENPNSLRNIYSQDIPKGRPGTFQQDVLQCFIFAF